MNWIAMSQIAEEMEIDISNLHVLAWRHEIEKSSERVFARGQWRIRSCVTEEDAERLRQIVLDGRLRRWGTTEKNFEFAWTQSKKNKPRPHKEPEPVQPSIVHVYGDLIESARTGLEEGWIEYPTANCFRLRLGITPDQAYTLETIING